jgi:hypothetical protein
MTSVAPIVGLGHPRCGTGFTASLLAHNGVPVGHEKIGPAGIISWMQVARRNAGPWGDTIADYPPGTKVVLVARSPLAALNSVATENQQIRSIGFRSQVIWERRGIDLFVWTNQTAAEGIYDFFGWAVMSLAYWYDICLEENPEVIFRIDRPDDDALLSATVGHPVTRAGKDLWRNEHGPGKKSHKLNYPISELARVPKHHLAKLIDVTRRLGYPEDAETLAAYL